MHEFTASVQSVTWLSVLLRIRARLGFFIFSFSFFPFSSCDVARATTENAVPLYRARYASRFSAAVPFYLGTPDPGCISLSVVMRGHKRACIVSSTWNLSAIGSWRVRKIIVDSVLVCRNWPEMVRGTFTVRWNDDDCRLEIYKLRESIRIFVVMFYKYIYVCYKRFKTKRFEISLTSRWNTIVIILKSIWKCMSELLVASI